eukprot:5906467-Karenia_brevis.AAC.1
MFCTQGDKPQNAERGTPLSMKACVDMIEGDTYGHRLANGGNAWSQLPCKIHHRLCQRAPSMVRIDAASGVCIGLQYTQYCRA